MRLFKKMGFAISILSGVFALLFLLFFLLGDPSEMMAGQNADQKTKDAIRKDLGLDLSITARFLSLVNDWSPISNYSEEAIQIKGISVYRLKKGSGWVLKFPYWGVSYQSRRPVADIIMEALPATVLLAFSALFFAIVIGIPLGTWAALCKGSKKDNFIITFSSLGISAPSFFLSILIAYLFGIVWHDYTRLDFMGSMYTYNPTTGEKTLSLSHLILPCISLGIRPLAIIVQMTRSSVLEVLQMEFIKTLKAKGISRPRLIWRHLLPNSLNPVVTSITGWLAELLAGSFFVEYIFGWQGIGMLTIGALEKLDLPLVFSSIMVSAAFFVIITQITDWLYRVIDPRLQ